MTAHELARNLLKLPDTELVGRLCVKLSDETISHRSYKYSYDYIDGVLGLGDIGYSDNTTYIDLTVSEDDLNV